MSYAVTAVTASNISCSQLLTARTLDGEWQVKLFNIRSAQKNKSTTHGEDMSGKLKWILDKL